MPGREKLQPRNPFHPRLRRMVGWAAAWLAMATAGTVPAHADDIVHGHVLVNVTTGTNISTFATGYGVTVQDHVALTGVYSLSTPKGSNEQNFVKTLLADKRVVSAEPDRQIVSAEVDGQPFRMAFDLTRKPSTYINAAAYTQINMGQTDWLSQINGKSPLATGEGVIVAVLDTGATYTHPDLAGHFLPGYNAITPDQLPVDMADGLTNAEVGHGTMIAGLLARLAPKAQILPIRILNGDGVGTILSLIKGIDYANAHGARVLNMSFSLSTDSNGVSDAFDRSELAGLVLVAAAGNRNSEQPQIPAVKHGSIAVAAVESNNIKSDYSNYGSWVKVSAPGSNIRSTYVDGGYATWSGTSFAAPFVAAEAALILSVNPTLTSDQVKGFIRGNTRSIDSLNSKAYKGKLGKGIIDVEAAVRAALP